MFQEKFSEKIDYELTERIRVVSCRHTFPIWIDNLVIPVGVGKYQCWLLHKVI